MNHTDVEQNRIAATIRNQFGAGAMFMVGAKCLVYGEDENGKVYLQFKFMRNAVKATHCRITLDEGTDTYTMTFLKVRNPSTKALLTKTTEEIVEMAKPKTVKEVKGVYCDTLTSTFRDITGLEIVMPMFVNSFLRR